MDADAESEVAKALGAARPELEQHAARLKSYLLLTCSELRDSGEAKSFRFRWVDDTRVKQMSSVFRAMEERGFAPADMWLIDDIIGARVVVVSPSDVRTLADAIIADANCPMVDTRGTSVDDSVTGYQAIHLKGRMHATVGEVLAEIQIRTALQDAWGVVSREDLYKQAEPGDPYVEMMRIQARHLSAVDKAFDAIRRRATSAPAAHPAAAEKDLASTDSATATEALTITKDDGQADGAQLPPRDALAPAVQTQEEEFVARATISPSRVQAFLDGYLDDRSKAASTETLFRRVGAFRQVPEHDDRFAAGFDMLLQKGPFVERSNWLAYSTWDFAVAQERRLLGLLDERLHRAATPSAGSVKTNWRDLLDAMDQLLIRTSADVTLFVVAGRLLEGLLPAPEVTPAWELPKDLQGFSLTGAYKGIPILHIRESSLPALYAVDLPRFATLTQYGSEPEFELRTLTEEEITELLPRMTAEIGGPEQARQRLSVAVRLRLFEFHSVDVLDGAAVVAVTLNTDD